MKKYLFGLGAMVVGAGLMFVLMHGDVSAEVESSRCDVIGVKTFSYHPDLGDKEPRLRSGVYPSYTYCKIKDLTCVVGGGINSETLSCVKTKGGIFR